MLESYLRFKHGHFCIFHRVNLNLLSKLVISGLKNLETSMCKTPEHHKRRKNAMRRPSKSNRISLVFTLILCFFRWKISCAAQWRFTSSWFPVQQRWVQKISVQNHAQTHQASRCFWDRLHPKSRYVHFVLIATILENSFLLTSWYLEELEDL